MQKNKYIFVFLSILILGTGIFFRFWKLNLIPPGVHYDEAFNGVDALKANESEDYKIFYPENYGREGFHINAIAFSIKIFGNSNFGLRFANALWGSLTLLGFWFLLRELKLSKLSVLAGTFMLVFSFWHLAFSRTAYRAIMVPLILVWSFYFFWKAKNNISKRYLYLAVAGIFLGLGFHTYISFRIVPLIFLLVASSIALSQEKFLRKNWKNILIFFLTFLIVFLPLLIYFSDHIKDLVSRSEAVSVFNAPKGMTFWQAFSKSFFTHLLAFFAFGDKNPRHNFDSQPLLPAAWSVLLVMGLVISFREIGKTLINFFKSKGDSENKFRATKWFHVSVLGQGVFWAMLVPGFLSIEGIPHSLRIIGAIPGVFILSVLPLEYILNFYQELKSHSFKFLNKNNFLTIFGGLLIFVVVGGLVQMHTYFRLWAKDTRTLGAYERKLYDFGMLVKDLPIHKNNYIITAFNTWVKEDKKSSSLKTTEYLAWPNIKEYSFLKPMNGWESIDCEDAQIVFLESDQWLRDQYRQKCPELNSVKRYSYDNGKYVFWVISNK